MLVQVNVLEDLLQTLLGTDAEWEESWHGNSGILGNVLVPEELSAKAAHNVLADCLQEDVSVGYADCGMTSFSPNAG